MLKSIAALFAALFAAPAAATAQDEPVTVPARELARHLLSGPCHAPRPRMSSLAHSIDVTIDEIGNVVAAEPTPAERSDVGHLALGDVAHAGAAARTCRFRPFVRAGRAVAAWGTVYARAPTIDAPAVGRTSMPVVARDRITITLARSGSYGPAGTPYTVTIRGDGRVRFEAPAHALAPGVRNYRIPVERVEALHAALRDEGFWSLEPESRRFISHAGTDVMTVTAGSERKTVTDRTGGFDAPEPLRQLRMLIDQAVDTARWTTGNARTIETLAAEGFDFHSPAAAEMVIRTIDEAPQVALALIERGAPMDAVGRCRHCEGLSYRQAALLKAARAGRTDLFQRLDSDAAFATLSQQGKDRILLAAVADHNPRLVDRLLAIGADANAKVNGWAPLIRAVTSSPADPEGDADQPGVVRLLLAAGADLEATDGYDTALQEAGGAEPEAVLLLLAAGADVDAGEATERRPLLYRTEDEEIALLALAAGADRTLVDWNDRTLAERARAYRWRRVEALLARGTAAAN